jgi:hypothetical protein
LTKLTAELSREIDPATGLPIIPEGYVWRVKKTSQGDSLVIKLVQLKVTEKVLWIFTRTVSNEVELESAYVWDHEVEYTNSTFSELLRKRALSIIDNLKDENRLEALVGEYPPKKLPR